MRIASWNINSVRLRQDSVVRFLDDYQPDILGLQETKTPDEFFPYETFKKAGYEYLHFNGMKSYNGVCFISKLPFTAHHIHHRVEKQDCRHIAVSVHAKGFDQPIMVDNLYIPAGGDEPNPDINEKFDHKLKFVDEMAGWFMDEYDRNQAAIVMGDFNIAPFEHDVWSHKQLLNVVSHTPIEVEKLNAMRDAFGWVDVAREIVPMDEKLYSWWSYRARDWEASDRGRRLDHIWVSPALKPYIKDFKVIKEARGWEKPSDHAPIIADLNFG